MTHRAVCPASWPSAAVPRIEYRDAAERSRHVDVRFDLPRGGSGLAVQADIASPQPPPAKYALTARGETRGPVHQESRYLDHVCMAARTVASSTPPLSGLERNAAAPDSRASARARMHSCAVMKTMGSRVPASFRRCC